METVLVEIYVPAIGMAYDMFLPADALMHEVLPLIKKAVSDISNSRFLADNTTLLCYRESGAIININLSAAELGIHNGSKLMLI